MVVYNFLPVVILCHFILTHISHSPANIKEQMYMAMYGSADISPVSFMLNFRTSEKYFGRSVIIVKYPQSWPIWKEFTVRYTLISFLLDKSFLKFGFVSSFGDYLLYIRTYNLHLLIILVSRYCIRWFSIDNITYSCKNKDPQWR